MVEESGFVFSPSDGAWFRFANCPTYKRLCGVGICEMDFAYRDPARGHVVLLEIKDYTGRDTPSHLVDSLIAKGRDSLIMLHSVWRAYAGQGASLRDELPEFFRVPSRLQLIFVLKVDRHTRMMTPLNEMGDQLGWKIRPYLGLLGLEGRAILMDQEKALRIGLPLRSL
jgi:hypothetical protein